jgi:hypothetical protein
MSGGDRRDTADLAARSHSVAGAAAESAQASLHDEGRFNLSAWALRHQALVVFLIALATLAGILAYTRLAQSEDPPFTFRVMVIRTLWPGATAKQVQEQVTDRIERKLQEMPYIDFSAAIRALGNR